MATTPYKPGERSRYREVPSASRVTGEGNRRNLRNLRNLDGIATGTRGIPAVAAMGDTGAVVVVKDLGSLLRTRSCHKQCTRTLTYENDRAPVSNTLAYVVAQQDSEIHSRGRTCVQTTITKPWRQCGCTSCFLRRNQSTLTNSGTRARTQTADQCFANLVAGAGARCTPRTTANNTCHLFVHGIRDVEHGLGHGLRLRLRLRLRWRRPWVVERIRLAQRFQFGCCSGLLRSG